MLNISLKNNPRHKNTKPEASGKHINQANLHKNAMRYTTRLCITYQRFYVNGNGMVQFVVNCFFNRGCFKHINNSTQHN